MSRKSSQKRIEANPPTTAYSNAQKSTGPRTPEGKAKSADNATTHGFTSIKSNPLAPGCFLAIEDQQSFLDLLNDYTATYRPAERDELDLLSEAVYAKWRQQRLWIAETAQIEIAIAENEHSLQKSLPAAGAAAHLANGIAKSENLLKLYLRYDAQLHRHYRQCLKDLRDLQSERALSAPPEVPTPDEPISPAPVEDVPVEEKPVAHVPEPELPQPEIVTPPAVPNEPKPATELTDNERFEAYRARLLDQLGSNPDRP